MSASQTDLPLQPASTSVHSRLPLWQAGLFFYLAGMLILWVPPGMFWHDWQRSGQIVLIGLAALYLATARAHPVFDRHTTTLLLLVTAGGLVSSAIAHQPLWALTEVALMAGCLTIVMASASFRHKHGMVLDPVLYGAIALLCGLKILLFLAMYVVSLTQTNASLNPWLLMQGFSNLRFYGQFQTLTLSLLALPLLAPRFRRYTLPALLLLSLWWMLAIISGTRGTWMAMAVTMLAMGLVSPKGRQWAGWQCAGVLAGGVFFWLLFDLLPEWMGITVSNHPSDRLNTSLSLRDALWQQAMQMTLQHPLLGTGPMHFSEINNGNAVHPHNALLQWTAEWGIPSALCLAWLLWRAARGSLVWLKSGTLRPDTTDVMRLCLTASIVAALAQAMVDGVIVMPYSQLWLSILGGWLLAFYLPPDSSPAPRLTHSMTAWKVIAVFSAGLLLFTMVRDLPHVNDRNRQFLDSGGHLMPRFWQQGLITWKRE